MRFIRKVGVMMPLLLATAAPATVDIAGRWSHRNGFGVVIEQVGDTVTMPGLWSPVRGTMTEPGSFVELTPIGAIPPGCAQYAHLRLVPGAPVMHGTEAFGCAANPPLWQFRQFVLTRCGCDDGNSIDGDGCDSHCQIEPCFTCAGTPSVCTPSADGALCDDRSMCTAGETCLAETCGGAAVPDCVDLAGPWRVRFEEPSFAGVVIEEDVVVEQRDNVVIVPTAFAGPWVGIVDPASGALELDVASVQCAGGGRGRVTGTAGTSSFATTGAYPVSTVMDCDHLDVEFTGQRLCVDDAACDDSDACTTGDACVDSLCQPGAPLECGACLSCDAALGCVAAPRTDCRPAGRNALQIADAGDAGREAIKWRWLQGAATTAAELGDPTDATEAALCIFDDSGPTPSLRFRASLPAGGTCGTRPCWKRTGNGFIYRGAADGLSNVTLRAGAAGTAKVLVKGKGAGLSSRPFALPAPPLDLPLRAQLQLDGAACFESPFEASDVGRNVPGIFKALRVP